MRGAAEWLAIVLEVVGVLLLLLVLLGVFDQAERLTLYRWGSFGLIAVGVLIKIVLQFVPRHPAILG